MKSLLRSTGLILAFIAGFLFPQFHVFSWLIPHFLRLMIFMVFIECHFEKIRVRRSHLLILSVNLLLGTGLCFLFRQAGWETLAETSYFLGIAPTAASAPAIMSFLGGSVEYVITSFILTTFCIAANFPITLPWAVGNDTPGVFFDVLWKVCSIIILPVIVALVIRKIWPSARKWTARFKDVVFVC